MSNPLGPRRSRTCIDANLEFFKNAIDCDGFDIQYFEDIKADSQVVRDTADEIRPDYEPWDDLHQDLFSALYKYRPELIEENRMQTNRFINRKLMEDIKKSPKYKRLRAMTRLDKINSTIGTEVLGQEVKEHLKEMVEEQKALQDLLDAEDNLDKLQQSDEESDKEGEEGEGTAQTDSPKISLEEAKCILEEARDKFDETFKKNKKESTVSKMLDKVLDQTQQMSDMIQNWGLLQDGAFEKKPYHEKMALIDRLRSSQKLKRIAELAGRYKRLAAKSQWEKVKKGVDELYSIHMGSEIDRLIPSELMRLRHPTLKKTFYADYLEGKLLQYSLKGKEKKGKGPIIVAIDESGSMHGLPEIWAKSVALAMLEIAKSQKRSMFVIHFDSTSNPANLHTNRFYKDKPFSIEEIIDVAEHFCNGGTLFEPALNLSRKFIDEESVFEKADIVFITDGECAVTNTWLKDFLEWKKRRKIEVRSILIDSYAHTTRTLHEFSDTIDHLRDLKEDSKDPVAITLFESL